MELEEIQKEFDEIGYLKLSETRWFKGIFDNKVVKPEKKCIKYLDEFENGDKVIIFNLEDFKKHVDGCDFMFKVLRDMHNTKE